MKKESLEGKTALEITNSIPIGHSIAVSNDYRQYASDKNMHTAIEKLRLQGYEGIITVFTHYDPEKKLALPINSAA